jgi:hypothetical protein
MNLWPNHTSFSPEEIVLFCEVFFQVFPQESFPDEYEYFQQLMDDNS